MAGVLEEYRFTRKRSLERENCILYFRFIFSRRVPLTVNKEVTRSYENSKEEAPISPILSFHNEFEIGSDHRNVFFFLFR